MNGYVYEDSKNRITKQIGIPLFECYLALSIAQNTVENLAKRSNSNEFALQLNQVTGLLATCCRQLTKLIETLDTVFDSSSMRPDQSRE